MQLIVNGENRSFDTDMTVQDLLDRLSLTGRLAVEVNRNIVPRSRYPSVSLQAGDRVEIVRAIGGG